MNKIYKYKLRDTFAPQWVELPKDRLILCVEEQRGDVCIWATVGVGDKENVKFKVVPTGGGHPDGGTYVGTVMLDNGDIVLHVFVFSGN